MSSSPPVELVVTSFDDPLVTGLRAQRAAETGPEARCPGPDTPRPGTKASRPGPEARCPGPGGAQPGAAPYPGLPGYGPAAGRPSDAGLTCLVARQAGEPVGYAGLRRLGDDTAEVERVYVRPGYRGPDIARLLLAGVEDLARRRGFAVARLEAGDLSGAGLYVANGYVRIAPFGRYPARSVCLEKSLLARTPARPTAPPMPPAPPVPPMPAAPAAPWSGPPFLPGHSRHPAERTGPGPR